MCGQTAAATTTGSQIGQSVRPSARPVGDVSRSLPRAWPTAQYWLVGNSLAARDTQLTSLGYLRLLSAAKENAYWCRVQ